MPFFGRSRRRSPSPTIEQRALQKQEERRQLDDSKLLYRQLKWQIQDEVLLHADRKYYSSMVDRIHDSRVLQYWQKKKLYGCLSECAEYFGMLQRDPIERYFYTTHKYLLDSRNVRDETGRRGGIPVKAKKKILATILLKKEELGKERFDYLRALVLSTHGLQDPDDSDDGSVASVSQVGSVRVANTITTANSEGRKTATTSTTSSTSSRTSITNETEYLEELLGQMGGGGRRPDRWYLPWHGRRRRVYDSSDEGL